MRTHIFAALIAIVMLSSPVFALNITVTTDKTNVFYGDDFTVSGTIAYENGTTGVFDYRASAIAPDKTLICDSGRKQTDVSGAFSLLCSTSSITLTTTSHGKNSSAIPAATTRAVVPVRAGVAVLDPEKFEIVKKHAQTILVMNKARLQAELDKLSREISRFANKSSEIIAECDRISEKAVKYNLTKVIDRCNDIKTNVTSVIEEAKTLAAQAVQASNDITADRIKDFRDGLSILNGDMKDLRHRIAELRKDVASITWNKLKEISKSKQSEIKAENVKKITAATVKNVPTLTSKVKDLRGARTSDDA